MFLLSIKKVGVLSPGLGPPNTRKMPSSWSKFKGRPLKWSEGWNTSLMKKGGGSCACSAWREGSGETSFWPSRTRSELINRRGINFLHEQKAIGKGQMVLNWKKNLDYILEETFLLRVCVLLEQKFLTFAHWVAKTCPWTSLILAVLVLPHITVIMECLCLCSLALPRFHLT